LRKAICNSKKCKGSADCKKYCKDKLKITVKEELELSDMENIEIELDEDFEIEFIDLEESEYEDLDLHMLGMCNLEKCKRSAGCRNICKSIRVCKSRSCRARGPCVVACRKFFKKL